MNSSLIFHVEILFSVFGLSVHFICGTSICREGEKPGYSHSFWNSLLWGDCVVCFSTSALLSTSFSSLNLSPLFSPFLLPLSLSPPPHPLSLSDHNYKTKTTDMETLTLKSVSLSMLQFLAWALCDYIHNPDPGSTACLALSITSPKSFACWNTDEDFNGPNIYVQAIWSLQGDNEKHTAWTHGSPDLFN